MRRIWAFENDAVLAVAAPPESGHSQLFLHREVQLAGELRQGALAHRFLPEETRRAGSRPFLRRLKTHLYDRLVRHRKREGES